MATHEDTRPQKLRKPQVRLLQYLATQPGGGADRLQIGKDVRNVSLSEHLGKVGVDGANFRHRLTKSLLERKLVKMSVVETENGGEGFLFHLTESGWEEVKALPNDDPSSESSD